MKDTLKNWRNAVALAGIVLGLVIVPYSITLAQNPNATVFPPNSEPFGQTYGEWSAAWWQWAYSIAKPQNPLLDETGKNCAVGQHGPVWFLGGTFVVVEAQPGVFIGQVTRNCTIPADKGILFPVINAECSTVEGNGTTEAELRSCAVGLVDHVTVTEATVDEVKLRDLNPPNSPFRVGSPLFSFTLPPNNILGINHPSPNPSPAVADGYWILLEPLTPGAHTVHFHGVAPFPEFGFTFETDVTYHLIVQ